jgi:hypothetical protein
MAEAIQALDRLHVLASETPDKVTRQQTEEFLTLVDGLFRGGHGHPISAVMS